MVGVWQLTGRRGARHGERLGAALHMQAKRVAKQQGTVPRAAGKAPQAVAMLPRPPRASRPCRHTSRPNVCSTPNGRRFRLLLHKNEVIITSGGLRRKVSDVPGRCQACAGARLAPPHHHHHTHPHPHHTRSHPHAAAAGPHRNRWPGVLHDRADTRRCTQVLGGHA